MSHKKKIFKVPIIARDGCVTPSDMTKTTFRRNEKITLKENRICSNKRSKINPPYPEFGINDISIKERMTQLSLSEEGRPPALRPGMVGATRPLSATAAIQIVCGTFQRWTFAFSSRRKVETFFVRSSASGQSKK
ncbi:hypothetical protein TNCT_173871 [Trichonephila clavata]|uniref:Uncharacterized protein n=1 Tax=Trichonephila clavata TaxID=2740835 RepID=A0A8X6FUE8_TRICU|nr:hypothetical protein TNCT_173871 [Trichonephila clavata]